MSENSITVEVAYCASTRQKAIAVKLATNATAEEAIRRSGILAEFPEIDLDTVRIGIYSKACRLDTTLHDKDRVEIYRPLIADPKEVRRQRAAEGKATKKGGNSIED